MSKKTTSGITLHIVRRSFEDLPCFSVDDDYLVYLDCLKEGATKYRCAILAYGLMAHEVHLLVGADTEERALRMVRYVSIRYSEYMNYIHQHQGEIWECRVDATRIGRGEDLLACCRYVESRPVEAGMGVSLAECRWSSYNHHAHGSADRVVHDSPAYLMLGTSEHERQIAYRDLAAQPFAAWIPAKADAGCHGRSGRAQREARPARRVPFGGRAVDAALAQA